MTSFAHTLGDTIANNARWYGDRLAVVGPDRSLTHGDLAERGRRLASALFKRGLKEQDRVAILAENCEEYLECYAAAELTGLVLVTVNYRLAVPEILHILADSTPSVLIFQEKYSVVVQQIGDQVPFIEHCIQIGDPTQVAEGFDSFEAIMASGDPATELPRAAPQDIAYLIYTSGTTGRPKGCMLGQSNQVESARTTSSHMLLSADDRTLLVMPLYHVGAKNIQLAAHWLAGSVYLHSSFDAEAMLRTVQQDRITVLHLAPTMLQMMLDCPAIDDYDLSSVRMVLYSAAPMPLPLLRAGIRRIGPVFAQIYGQTEGLGTILNPSSHRPDGDTDDLRRLTSVGHPYQGTRMRVVDDQDQDVPVRIPGELLVDSPTVMRGYWNNHAATAETLRGGWLHSGDIATIDENGYVYLVDRKKDVIISGGENIYSREVEDALYRHPAVREVAVVGTPDEKWGEVVTAFVVLADGNDMDGAALVEHCRTQLAGFKRPRRVEFLQALPRLASGKVNKLQLRDAALNGSRPRH